MAHALTEQDKSNLTQWGLALLGPGLPVPTAMQSVTSLVPAHFPPRSHTSCVRLFKKKNECGGSYTEMPFLEAALIT